MAKKANEEHGNENKCPKCDFIKSKQFPNGYTIEGNSSLKHCPACGYWSNQE
jgi:rubrerythrin